MSSSFIHLFTIHSFMKHLLGFSMIDTVLGGDSREGGGEKGKKFPEMNNPDELLILKVQKSKIMFYHVMNTIRGV